MFGLMKNTGCLQSEQPDWYRLHYCGTCKSLGKIYGQRSRLFLNHDIVFLAEILSLLQNTPTQKWDKALFSKNCFDSPKIENIPLSLQYAADINTILVELKVRDNLTDDFSEIWKWAKMVLNKPFSKIEERIEKWDIDHQLLLDLQLEDLNREEVNPSQKTINELLTFHAESSAKITAYLFSKGTEIIQKTNAKDTIHEIGFAFGELTYGLDAWRDLEKDKEGENFNPLLFFPEETIENRKTETANWIWEKANQIENLIQKIEIDAEIKKSLQARLKINLAAALGTNAHVCSPKTGIEKATVPTVVRGFWKMYRQLASWLNPLRPSRFVVSYVVFLFVFFQQKLMAAVDILKQPQNGDPNQMILIAGLIAIPIGLFYGGKKLKKNEKRIRRKLKRKRKRLLRRLRRAEKRFKKGKKLKWWQWTLIIIGAILLLLIFITISTSGESGGGCGSGSNDCDGSGCCGGGGGGCSGGGGGNSSCCG